MDDDIRGALADLKTDIKGGFEAVNRRIDDMVTRNEFTATVQRVDAQHVALRDVFNKHELDTHQRYKTVQESDDSIRLEMRAEFEKMRGAQRWALGLLIPAAALIATIIFSILSLIR